MALCACCQTLAFLTQVLPIPSKPTLVSHTTEGWLTSIIVYAVFQQLGLPFNAKCQVHSTVLLNPLKPNDKYTRHFWLGQKASFFCSPGERHCPFNFFGHSPRNPNPSVTVCGWRRHQFVQTPTAHIHHEVMTFLFRSCQQCAQFELWF